MMAINSLKGTKDIFWPEVEIWQKLEEVAREVFNIYSYREIRTPIIELTPLFTRSIGQSSDIVQKEMYSFEDKGHRQISLRPEETASVVRAYVQHGIFRQKRMAKFYYIGPMFRSERPQAGRMRQFHQIGVEAIGSREPLVDVEIIVLLNEILKRVKTKDYHFRINSLGCGEDRKKYREILKKDIKPHCHNLCPDCKKRYDFNILRILDCKNKNCRGIVSKLPVMRSYLCEECREHFKRVISLLDEFEIPKRIDAHLVRGLDYYTRTAFEVIAGNLGAKDAVAAGGRYDSLVGELGGPETGACGFAIGVERLISSITEGDRDSLVKKKRLFVYIVYFDEKTRLKGFQTMFKLREAGVSVEMDYAQANCPSLKSQMRQANVSNADYAIIIGEDEVKSNTYAVKNMKSGQQQIISQEQLLNFFGNF